MVSTQYTSEYRLLGGLADGIDRLLSERQLSRGAAELADLIDSTAYIPTGIRRTCERLHNMAESAAHLGKLGEYVEHARQMVEAFELHGQVLATQERQVREFAALGHPVRNADVLLAAAAEYEAARALWPKFAGTFSSDVARTAREALARGDTLSLEEVFGALPS